MGNVIAFLIKMNIRYPIVRALDKWEVWDDKWTISFLSIPENACCDSSSELLRGDGSDEGHNIRFIYN